jgi:hypothetical protein
MPPDIVATGCFRRIRFERASSSRFRTRYEAGTEADLERYLHEHAPRLRTDFQAHFPAGSSPLAKPGPRSKAGDSALARPMPGWLS